MSKFGNIVRALCGRGAAFAKKFMRAEHGNIAVIYALTATAFLSAGGAGIDYARAMMVKNRMATALDAAALAVGTTKGLTDAQLQTLAQQYFTANYSNALGATNPVTVTVTGTKIALSVTGSVPTALLQVAGINSINLAVSNQIDRSMSKLWVALVLDNTGSMSDTDKTYTSKMSALKSATHQLLTQLQAAAQTDGDVRVSIVPFNKDVNVDPANYLSAWLDWSYWDAQPSSAPSSSVGPGSSCPYSGGCDNTSGSGRIQTSGTYAGMICPTGYNGCYNSVATTTTSTSTTGPTTGSSSTVYICQSSSNCKSSSYCSAYPQTSTSSSTSTSGNTTTVTTVSTVSDNCSCGGSGNNRYCTVRQTPTTTSVATTTTTGAPYTHTWIPVSHTTWNGCVMDRDQSNDVSNTTPTTSSSTKFPVEVGYSACPTSLLGLTYDWTALSNKVDAMVANGGTNQTIGLAWGWQTLTQGVPMSPPTLPDGTVRYIIILSDGLNTQDRWYGNGSTQSTSVDNRMALVCTNAKADNVKIFSVFVDLNGTQGNSTVLQNCASSSDMYFDLTTSGQIVTTFNQIGSTLVNLHLSR